MQDTILAMCKEKREKQEKTLKINKEKDLNNLYLVLQKVIGLSLYIRRKEPN